MPMLNTYKCQVQHETLLANPLAESARSYTEMACMYNSTNTNARSCLYKRKEILMNMCIYYCEKKMCTKI